MHSRRSEFAFALIAAVIVFQIACPVVIASSGAHLSRGTFATSSDASRYRAIAEAPGTPYRDFDVEYPPAALGLFHVLGPRHFDAFRLRLLALQVACQALIVGLLFLVWNRRAAWSYLVLSTPMLFVVYTSYDLVGVALAVTGAALVRRRHPVAGAIGLVIGAFTKVWPAVLVPGLLVPPRRLRAFVTAVAVGGAGLLGWIAWGGPGAIGQVVAYRGARGWQYESVPGSLFRLVTRDALRFEGGAWRLGAPPRVLSILISVGAIAAVAGIWWLAVRGGGVTVGVPETAAITAVLVFATLCSAHFLIWPLPFVAIAAAAGARRLERWAGAVALLTFLDWLLYNPSHPASGPLEVAIVARNVALVGLLVAAVAALRPQPSNRRQKVGSQRTL